MLYRNFRDQGEIDAAYCTDDGIDLVELSRRYAAHSARARDQLTSRLGLKYGPTRAETLDFFPARDGAPLLIFIHGGYWRAGSARDSGMLAIGPATQDIGVALVDYALCPAMTIDEITRQCRAAVAWLWQQADALRFDREKIYVAGHSAGGQLVGMLLVTDWCRDYGLPANLIKGALAISGIFDLRPLRYSWLQPRIQLNSDTIARQSPLFHIPSKGPPLVVTCGGVESAEFHRQSQEYLAAWLDRGLNGHFVVQPGANHFTAVESLAEPGGLLTKVVEELIVIDRGDKRLRRIPHR